MAATAASDVNDGPVLSLINKRLRALRKKLNRILQMEDSIAQGKPINKEQEDVLHSKPSVVAAIDELEKLRQPLSVAVSEEIDIAIQRHQLSSADSDITTTTTAELDNKDLEHPISNDEVGIETSVVEDLLNVLYFGSMFDVKPQSDFTATMLTRTHERGCCLTYDYVTDDAAAADMLGERDLDLISMLGGLLISRPVNSSLSHKNALQQCIQQAKLWLSKSNQPIAADSTVTYAALRDKLNKIMSSDYFTTTPAMKAAVEVVAAAGSYGSFQVPVHGSMVPMNVPVQVEGSSGQYQQQEVDSANLQENDSYDNQSVPVEELQKGELEVENFAEASAQAESLKLQVDVEQNASDVDSKEQQHVSLLTYQNQRGGRGGGGSGRRGYSNGRGGRGGGRGGQSYQNGRNQYYDQRGNYYSRNYYNNRVRGGRGGGGNSHNYHGSVQAVHVQAD